MVIQESERASIPSSPPIAGRAILTDDPVAAARFLHQVDAAAVYHNASPRFSDGGQFGMGVEVAVSTSRLHPRGPVGPAELISMKWIGTGDYLARP